MKENEEIFKNAIIEKCVFFRYYVASVSKIDEI